MKRLLIASIAALALAGCKNSPPPGDPFLRTTVPPPGTGYAPDAYYPGGAPSAAPPAAAQPIYPGGAPPAYPGAAPTGPPPAKFQAPGGTINLQQSSNEKNEKATPLTKRTLAKNISVADVQEDEDELPLAAAADKIAKDKPEQLAESDELAQAGEVSLPSPAQTRVAVRAFDAFAEPPSDAPIPVEEPSMADAVVVTDAPNVADTEPEQFVKVEQENFAQNNVRIAATAESDEPESAPPVGETVIRILSAAPEEETVARAELAAAEPAEEVQEEVEATQEPPAVTVRPSPRIASAAPPAEMTDAPQEEFRPKRRSTEVIQTSHTVPISETAQAEPVAARTAVRPAVAEIGGPTSPATRYWHAPGYGQLHGRLEYSQSLKQWKIRYIPIDGQTDSYGGSVVLANSPALGKFRSGDFVSVEGSIGQKQTSRGFSPTYELRQIESLR